MTSGLPLLTVDGGPNNGKTMPLAKPRVTLGRADDNDVAIGGPGVSRKHAEIVRGDVGYHLHDLGSTNGTSVNGIGIAEGEHLLKHGDEIRLGNSKVYLVFRTDAQSTVKTPVVKPKSEQAGPPASAPESVKEATSSRSPELPMLQYLESHPEGADVDTLRTLTGLSSRDIVVILARLLDTGQIHQRELTFFAGAAPGTTAHICMEHRTSFERYEVGGIVLYAHIEVGEWCVADEFSVGPVQT